MINHHSDDNWHKILLLQQSVTVPTLSQLANVLLMFNAENATVEHGFSLQSGQQTPTRKHLLSSTADKLMCLLKLNAASYKTFNYNRAYALWLQSSTCFRSIVSSTVNTETEVNEINT